MTNDDYIDVITFWFDELTPSDWFKKSDELDKRIRTRFTEIYKAVASGKTEAWRQTPEGRLAEVIVLDQFSRNIFRDSKDAFLHDELALKLSQEAIRTGDNHKLSLKQKRFLYMPFMHSESQSVHVTAMQLFESLDDTDILEYEIQHKAIIDQFGRYPHRNAILGRESTKEELEFLQDHGGF